MISSLKKTAIATAAASSILATAANAADIYQGGVVVPSATNLVFYSSDIKISIGNINFTDCNLILTSDIIPDGNGGMNIQVTDGNIGGEAFCTLLTFTNFPWTSHIPSINVPNPPENTLVPITINNAVLQAGFFGSCGPGPIPMMYSNGSSVPNTDASSFKFATPLTPGNCSITGTLSTQMPYSTEDIV